MLPRLVILASALVFATVAYAAFPNSGRKYAGSGGGAGPSYDFSVATNSQYFSLVF